MHFTTKWETRSESITWRQNQSQNEVFTAMNAAEEPGSRATAQIFYNYQQQLHKQHCSSHLPGESVTSMHSSRSCYPRHRMNMFTTLKKQAIYYDRSNFDQQRWNWLVEWEWRKSWKTVTMVIWFSLTAKEIKWDVCPGLWENWLQIDKRYDFHSLRFYGGKGSRKMWFC